MVSEELLKIILDKCLIITNDAATRQNRRSPFGEASVGGGHNIEVCVAFKIFKSSTNRLRLRKTSVTLLYRYGFDMVCALSTSL